MTSKMLKMRHKTEMVTCSFQLRLNKRKQEIEHLKAKGGESGGVQQRPCITRGDAHWTAVKRIIRYLQATQHHNFRFHRSGTINLTGYSGSDYAGDDEDRKSTSGSNKFTKIRKRLSLFFPI